MTTRNEEILKAAHELEYPENVPYFVNGAEWADKHPSKKSLRPPQKSLTNEEIEQAKKEYRDVALSKMDYIPEELTYDDGWDDAISYMKKSLRPQTGSQINKNG